MTDETALTTRPSAAALTAWGDPLEQINLHSLATVLDASGLYAGLGKGPERQARITATILWGLDLGLRPLEALAELHVINGKPAMSANLILRKLREHGRYDFRMVESTDAACEIEILRDGKPQGSVRWTIEDAKKAGLDRKDTWRSFPRDMLRSRAVTAAVRTYAPDLLGRATAYVAEELGEPRPVQSEARTKPAFAVHAGGDEATELVREAGVPVPAPYSGPLATGRMANGGTLKDAPAPEWERDEDPADADGDLADRSGGDLEDQLDRAVAQGDAEDAVKKNVTDDCSVPVSDSDRAVQARMVAEARQDPLAAARDEVLVAAAQAPAIFDEVKRDVAKARTHGELAVIGSAVKGYVKRLDQAKREAIAKGQRELEQAKSDAELAAAAKERMAKPPAAKAKARPPAAEAALLARLRGEILDQATKAGLSDEFMFGLKEDLRLATTEAAFRGLGERVYDAIDELKTDRAE